MSVYAERYGEPHVREDGTTYQTLAVRCGDCGQRAVETYNADSWLRCPDAAAGPCGNDPLTTERRDGPRYVEAVREGRRLRERALEVWAAVEGGQVVSDPPVTDWERRVGIPIGWRNQ